MTDSEKAVILREGLVRIREATFAEFQNEAPSKRLFQLDRHVCPVCRRASTAEHLHDSWALIQSIAAEVLRKIEEQPVGGET